MSVLNVSRAAASPFINKTRYAVNMTLASSGTSSGALEQICFGALDLSDVFKGALGDAPKDFLAPKCRLKRRLTGSSRFGESLNLLPPDVRF